MNSETTPAARIAALRNELRPAEARVVDALLDDPSAAVESTAQEIADRLGVARSSVIRTCQKLGYSGWPKLRVALARQIALAPAAVAHDESSALGALHKTVGDLATRLADSLGFLTEERLESVIDRLVDARRVLCLANGLSSPLASDLAMRLTAAGRSAEFVPDALAQQIAARRLGPNDLVVIVSGSGSNDLSLKTASAARRAGARIVAITSFETSALGDLADDALVIASIDESFRDELEHTSRIAHAVFLHALVPRVAARLGEDAVSARAEVLEVLGDNLSET